MIRQCLGLDVEERAIALGLAERPVAEGGAFRFVERIAGNDARYRHDLAAGAQQAMPARHQGGPRVGCEELQEGMAAHHVERLGRVEGENIADRRGNRYSLALGVPAA